MAHITPQIAPFLDRCEAIAARRGLTLSTWATAAGLSVNTLTQIRARARDGGPVTFPRLDTVIKLAGALHLPVSVLLGDLPDPMDPEAFGDLDETLSVLLPSGLSDLGEDDVHTLRLVLQTLAMMRADHAAREHAMLARQEALFNRLEHLVGTRLAAEPAPPTDLPAPPGQVVPFTAVPAASAPRRASKRNVTTR